MLPFVMRELAATVMKRKSLPLEDALFYIYSSRMYRSLLDENTKLWYQSTSSLYDDLEKEKAGRRSVMTLRVYCCFLCFVWRITGRPKR